MSDASVLRHMALAEAGKVLALGGDHAGALRQYRDAMNLALASRAPEVFFRHYLEAALESLELMKDFESVVQYCDKAIALYAAKPPENELAILDLATTRQRRGVMFLKLGHAHAARQELEEAQKIAAQVDTKLELAKVLLGWLARGLTVPPERVLAEQRRHRYFSVRADALRFVPETSAPESDSTTAAEKGAQCSTTAS